MFITVILKKTRRFFVPRRIFGGPSKSFGRRFPFIDFWISDISKWWPNFEWPPNPEIWSKTLETWDLSSGYIHNWLCVKELTKTLFSNFFIGGVWYTPPGSRCSSQTPGSDRVKYTGGRLSDDNKLVNQENTNTGRLSLNEGACPLVSVEVGFKPRIYISMYFGHILQLPHIFNKIMYVWYNWYMNVLVDT